LSWILAIPQFQHWPWTISATCLKSERPNTRLGAVTFWPSWLMFAIGPKPTSPVAPHMSAFGGKADMIFCGARVCL
jgi:hypothetical protein